MKLNRVEQIKINPRNELKRLNDRIDRFLGEFMKAI